MNSLKIFISHRSTDKGVADIIQTFLISLGVPREMIFCSSLPGSDVKEKISAEIKEAIKKSCLNIVILSHDYYDSAYCLNEAGIMWFMDTLVVPIALPEISDTSMIGFLNNEYKLRRLNIDNDIAYINDCLNDVGVCISTKATVVGEEIKKVIKNYNTYIDRRPESTKKPEANIYVPTTDDEMIVTYYIASQKIRKISKENLEKWFYENEIYNVNIDNAFDLISSSGIGTLSDNTLTLEINAFRIITSYNENDLSQYKTRVDNHKIRSAESFKNQWDNKTLDDEIVLFISYILDERMFSFGERWMADKQIQNIKQWESKNMIDNIVSSNYARCLSMFIDNKWVYPCGFTSYGNPREYALHNSIKQELIKNSEKYNPILDIAKENYKFDDLPF